MTRGRIALDRNEIQNLNDQVEERVAAVSRLLVRHLDEAADAHPGRAAEPAVTLVENVTEREDVPGGW